MPPKETKVGRKKALYSLLPEAVEKIRSLAKETGRPLSHIVEEKVLGWEFPPDVEAFIAEEARVAGISREAMIERALVAAVSASSKSPNRKQ